MLDQQNNPRSLPEDAESCIDPDCPFHQPDQFTPQQEQEMFERWQAYEFAKAAALAAAIDVALDPKPAA
jgi:hypothetical protein